LTASWLQILEDATKLDHIESALLGDAVPILEDMGDRPAGCSCWEDDERPMCWVAAQAELLLTHKYSFYQLIDELYQMQLVGCYTHLA